MKVTKDTYLEVLNEAERQGKSLSSVALQIFERGRIMDKQMKQNTCQDLTRRTHNTRQGKP